jgi:hypothetical protein
MPTSTPSSSQLGCICGIMNPNVLGGCNEGVSYDVTYYKCGENFPTFESFLCTVVARLCVNQSEPTPTAELGLATWIPSTEPCQNNDDCTDNQQN